jgi:hypothetical protein
MSYIIDSEYINKISYKLDKFKWKSPKLANFRCPICGDSAKKKNICRGFFHLKNDSFFMYCHNCGANMSLHNYLKENDPEVYRQYVIDKLKGENLYKPSKKIPTNTINKFGSKYGMQHISELDYTHPARVYLRNRQIPSNDAYFVENFFTWGSKQFPEKFKETIIDHPRIIFPAYDMDRNIIGYTCRSINGEIPKYYQLKMMDDFVFGLNRIDTSKPVYVVEGAIDSLFIPNCVATCNSALHMVRGLDECKKILIPDNDNRNPQIVQQVGKFIDLNFEVVIWPDSFAYKDINDAIVAGYSISYIMDIINNNTYKGLVAKMMYKNWRKV